jgi:hypothetical protein
LTTTADTDKLSPPGNIQLNDILGIGNSNGAATLDLSNNNNFSDFRTPLHTLEDPNIEGDLVGVKGELDKLCECRYVCVVYVFRFELAGLARSQRFIVF